MTSRQDRGGCPFSSASSEAGEARRGLQPGRRDLLMGLAGGAIGLGLGSQARATPAGTLAPGDDGTQDSQPFYGVHQSGVTTPQPAAALIVSFDALAEDRAGLERLFRTLTERIAFLMKGGEAATLDPRYPPPDSGLLGISVFPDNLTVTVALGSWASAAHAQTAPGNIANNDSVFIDGQTFQLVPGKGRGDVASQIKALGAREIGPGAIIFRSGNKLFIAGAPFAARAMWSELRRSFSYYEPATSSLLCVPTRIFKRIPPFCS